MKLKFTKNDFYKCRKCGRWSLRDGYEKQSGYYCIPCFGKKLGYDISVVALKTERKHFEYLIKTLDNQIETLKKTRKELEKEMKK